MIPIFQIRKQAQRGSIAYLRSHSRKERELGFKLKSWIQGLLSSIAFLGG